MRRLPRVLIVVIAIVFLANIAFAGGVGDAVTRAANRLVSQQAANGYWAGEEDFTGSIAAGLAKAYTFSSNASYKTAAQKAGSYIMNVSAPDYNYFGDEAYGLTCISQIQTTPLINTYRSHVTDFYTSLEYSEEGTLNYINSQIVGTDPANAVFYLANHVVAASYVMTKDREIWRNALIDALAKVNDQSAVYPVYSLGVAVWALAETGPMNLQTRVDITAPPSSIWYQKSLADLPIMLRGQQVAGGENAGSFYWRFDHTSGGVAGAEVSGFTEDAVFGAMGLIAAKKADMNRYNFNMAIINAQNALAAGVGSDGKMYEHLALAGESYNAYAGEALQVLTAPTDIPGDLNLDGEVNVGDLGILGAYYGIQSGALWSTGDMNGDGAVDVGDLGIMGSNYGTGGSGSIPEPATMCLLAVAGPVLLARRRQRS